QSNQPDLGGPWKLIKAATNGTITPPVTPPTDEKPSPDLSTDAAAWESNAVYGGNDKVSYQGKIYQAKWWSQGNTPTAGDPWALLP
ncbi:carbohydrate-binding protein, partial [Photobacterium phosphoreum]